MARKDIASLCVCVSLKQDLHIPVRCDTGDGRSYFMLKPCTGTWPSVTNPVIKHKSKHFLRYWRLLGFQLSQLLFYCCKCLNSLSYWTEGTAHITLRWYTRCSLLLWSEESVFRFNAYVTSCLIKEVWKHCNVQLAVLRANLIPPVSSKVIMAVSVKMYCVL